MSDFNIIRFFVWNLEWYGPKRYKDSILLHLHDGNAGNRGSKQARNSGCMGYYQLGIGLAHVAGNRPAGHTRAKKRTFCFECKHNLVLLGSTTRYVARQQKIINLYNKAQL